MIQEITPLIKKDASLEDNMKAVMKAAKHHWLGAPEGSKFNAAVAAVGAYYGEGSPEYERLKKASDQLKLIQAMQSGVPVDLGAAMGTMPDETEVKSIPLMKIWKHCDDPPEPKGGFIS